MASRTSARTVLTAVVIAGLAGSCHAQMQKQNTTWIYPTLGCRANRAGENCFPNCPMPANARCEKAAVCKPTYVKTGFNNLVEFTVAAANPTPPDKVYIIRSGGEPLDKGKSCCGFSPLLAEDIWSVVPKVPVLNPHGVIAPDIANWPPMSLADINDEVRVAQTMGGIVSMNLDPVNLNITWVKFAWNVTKQIDTSFAVTPLYNITFDARYGYSLTDGEKRLHNTSACTKQMIFRICSTPFFAAEPRDSTLPLIDAPKPADLLVYDHEECGLAKHTPCLRAPGRTELVNGVLINVFEMGMFDTLGNNHGVRVGEEVSLTFSLTTLDLGGKVKMQVVDDPGLPIGAILSDDSACGSHSVCRTLTWTPRKGQEGKVHDAHVVGQAYSTVDPAENPCDTVYTKETVYRIPVLTPQSEWLAPVENLGQTDYNPAWPGNAVVGTEFNITLQCKSNYMPKVDMDGSAARFELVETKDMGDGTRLRVYSFGYTPKRGDEGATKVWHFHCGDDQYVAPRLIRTVAVKTKLCSYTVDAGETLSTMTRRYQLSTNWLNVWNANPMLLTDPDLDLAAGSHVRIGPVYSVKNGDTLETIAAQFSTTVKKLLSVNPHLTPETAPDLQLPDSMRLCVIACTSHPSPTYSYKWAY